MKPLFESLLDIDSIDSINNVTMRLSHSKFRDLYKKLLRIVKIDKNTPVCIVGNESSITGLCENFEAKNIILKGLYPELKIEGMNNFALGCKNLVGFQGPNPHENYSDINSLECFFYSDIKLKSFDLSGIAESAKKIKYIEFMFNGCESIEIIDLSNFDFSKLTSVKNAFDGCKNLKHINLGDSNALIDANRMCMNDINLEEFNAPNMILSGNTIFFNCRSLRRINVRYVDVSNNYYNDIFGLCEKLENVNIFGFGKNIKYDYDYIDLSWAVSLDDKSWDFLFKNMKKGKNATLILPDISKKEKLIKKYESVAKQHNFKLI